MLDTTDADKPDCKVGNLITCTQTTFVTRCVCVCLCPSFWTPENNRQIFAAPFIFRLWFCFRSIVLVQSLLKMPTGTHLLCNSLNASNMDSFVT